MKITNLFLTTSIFIIVLFNLLPGVIAQNELESESDYPLFGLELEKILSLINGVIALVLCVIAINAYRTDGRSRFLYVSMAFLIFSIKSFLVSSEIFFQSPDWIDPLSIVLEFLVLLAFFYGVIKKRG